MLPGSICSRFRRERETRESERKSESESDSIACLSGIWTDTETYMLHSVVYICYWNVLV